MVVVVRSPPPPRPRDEFLGHLAFEDGVGDDRNAFRVKNSVEDGDKSLRSAGAEPSGHKPVHQLPFPLKPALLDSLLKPLLIPLLAPLPHPLD